MRKAKAWKSNKNSSLSKKFMLSAAKVVAQKIVEKRASNNGKAPWGFASSLPKQGSEIHPKMSMRTVNNYIKKLEKGSEYGWIILVENSSSNQLSSISNPIVNATAVESTSNSESIAESIANYESNAESNDFDDDSGKKPSRQQSKRFNYILCNEYEESIWKSDCWSMRQLYVNDSDKALRQERKV